MMMILGKYFAEHFQVQSKVQNNTNKYNILQLTIYESLVNTMLCGVLIVPPWFTNNPRNKL
jgi:hypothetical protein